MRKLFVRSAAAFVLAIGLPLAGCKSSPQSSVEVRIPLADATPTLKRATVVVDYARSGAKPQIAGGTPSCTSILPHVSCRFSDADGKLTIEAESTQGFSGPVDLAVCRMIPDSPGADAAAIAGRLRIEIADARGSDGQPIADIKVASKREPTGDAASAAPAGGEPGREGGGRHRAEGTDTAATEAPGTAPAGTAGATGQGMVVTQNDLAAREQRRAEEQMKAREAQKKRDAQSAGQAVTGVAPGGATGAITGGEDEVPLGEEPGTGVNDATDDDARATEYGVRFDLAATDGPLGALQFDVKYHGGSGGWLGAGGGAACTWLVSAALHTCNDKRGGDLTCAVVDTNGVSGPAALMECSFKSRNSVAAGDFSVNVTDASTPSLEPANARVFVSGVYAR
jgi:hypothetical protein